MNNTQTILVTGGAGYVGSHTVVELLSLGYRVVVIDNLSNSKIETIQKIKDLTGCEFTFHQAGLNETTWLRRLLVEEKIDGVIHFAAAKAVAESCGLPLKYYDANVSQSLNLMQAMAKEQIFKFVFSSSACVYNEKVTGKFTEESPADWQHNPYGRSKRMVEEILCDLSKSDPRWCIANLRYFNPIGAHSSGVIGDDPRGAPQNLMPYLMSVASGTRACLNVFGSDYCTDDGTGVRDYIHVVDVAKSHIKALEGLVAHDGFNSWNIGTGTGYTVLEVVAAFEKVTGIKIPLNFVDRRSGDVAYSVADISKVARDLGWRATFSLEQMIRDAWHFECKRQRSTDVSLNIC